jgi:hypothetical protein
MALRNTVGVLFAAAMILAGTQVHAAEAANERLKKDLLANPSFAARVPANRSVARLVVEGDIQAQDWRYERSPAAVPKVPRALDTYTVRNCDSQSTLLATGVLEGARTQTASLTTTRGWEVGTAVKFEIGFPLVGKTEWTFSGKYNQSTAQTDAQSQSVGVKHGYRSPARPGTQHELQLVVVEESVEGVPYSFDLVMSGPVRVFHDLESLWLPKRRLGDAFVGSDEPVGDSRRDLPVCRARHGSTYHPGKVVGDYCNITYAGKEIRKSRFQVLYDSAGLGISEKLYSGGDTDTEKGLVAGTEGSRACDAGRADYQECRDENPQQGKLYVCFAKHNVLLDDRGWHPGKLVRRDCMIGYGGKELAKGDYKILTYDGDPAESFVVNLEDYLTLEQRTFRIEGSFSGSYAGEAELVRGDSQPADQKICANEVAGSGDGTQPDASEKGTADSVQSGNVVYRTAQHSSGSDVFNAAAPDRPKAEPAVAGDVIAETVTQDGALIQRPIIRELELQSPLMFGDDVVAVQEALIERGYLLKLDGYYGPGTARAVRLFQKANGIEADGVVGGDTGYWLGLAPRTTPLPHRLPRTDPQAAAGS